MKVKNLTNKMFDGGTKPRVKVLKYIGDYTNLLVYEGRPQNIDKETACLNVNSFKVLGEGFIEIYAESKAR